MKINNNNQENGSEKKQYWRNQWKQGFLKFLRNPSGMIGLFLILMMCILHLGAPLFTKYDPHKLDVSQILQQPSIDHPVGTDRFGRDILSRVLYGGRTSLLVATVVTVLTTITGIIFGALSGFYPRLDGPIMRVMDLIMSFPSLLLAIACVAILGPQLLNVIIALVVPITPTSARLVRSVILSLKEQEFITAARAVGARNGRIIFRHLLPSVIPTLLVRQTFIFGGSILAEGGLNFLGIGVQPEVPTLGTTVAEGHPYIRTMPWISFSAGLAISLMVIGVNLLGDGLRDVLDPMMRE